MALPVQQNKTPLDVMERLLEVSEHFSSFWPFNETSYTLTHLLACVPKRLLGLLDRKVSGLLAMLRGEDTEQ